MLLVDDEFSIRQMMEHVLCTHNYQVIMADSGAAALEIFRSRSEEIPILVTDLLMPITKNSELFTGFVYTFEGGSATAIREPSQTVIGYVQGKYGRALMYSDSHAKWESRKP